MSIKITCPTCETVQRFPEDQAGERVRCKHCDEKMTLPGGRDDEREEDSRAAPQARRVTKAKNSGNSTLMWGLLAVGGVFLLLLCVAGSAACYFVYSVANAVDKTVSNIKQDFPGGQPKDLNEAIDWLNQGGGRRKNAAEWLEKQPVNAGRRTEVAGALERAVNAPGQDTFMRGALDSALAAWAGPENVTALVHEIEVGPGFFADDKIVNALVRLKSDQAARGLAKQLSGNQPQTHKVIEALTKMGPVAEDAVADVLSAPEFDHWGRVHACEILKKIGTRKSVAKVQQAMTRDKDLTFHANEALKEMQIR